MRKLALPLLAVLAVTGCNSNNGKSSENKPASQQAKPAKAESQALTGRAALQKMAIPAHLWAGDIQPISLESEPADDNNGSDGKSTFWRSAWGSETKRSAKNFSWSGSASDDANSRGITPGGEDSWSSGNTSMQAFNFGFLKIDSDAALSAAKVKLTPKDKAVPVKYSLTFDPLKQQLLWRVNFGGGEHGKTIDIDATTGGFVRTER
ncbi:MAG: hypothetical protein NVS9B15_10940 [Acidobacteriaceae bacterium]